MKVRIFPSRLRLRLHWESGEMTLRMTTLQHLVQPLYEVAGGEGSRATSTYPSGKSYIQIKVDITF
jgi:hypothetical protein